MDVNKSILSLNHFFIVNHEYRVIYPHQVPEDNEEINLFNDYNIDMDYAIKRATDEYFHLFTKININTGEKALPGYSLFIESITVFSFTKELEMDQRNQYLNVSGLGMAISMLRNTLATITAFGPFGKYLLPSIDLNKLIMDKSEEFKSRTPAKKATESSSKVSTKKRKI